MIKNTLLSLIIVLQFLGLIILSAHAIENGNQRFQAKRMNSHLVSVIEEMHRTVWGHADSAYTCKKK